MKPNQEREKDPSLDKVLRGWVVDGPLPPRFQEQVWQRITRAEDRPTLLTLLRSTLLALHGSLSRPKFAFAYMAVLLGLGVGAGSWAAQIKTNRLDSDLSMRYVQSIDPYRAGSSHP